LFKTLLQILREIELSFDGNSDSVTMQQAFLQRWTKFQKVKDITIIVLIG